LLPANISKIIRELELNLKAQILQRSATGVTLTFEGRKLSHGATEVLSSFEKLTSIESASAIHYERIVHVGSRGFLNINLGPVIAEYMEKYKPHWGAAFTDLSPKETIDAARSGALDLAIAMDRLDLSRYWKEVYIGDLTWNLYGKKNHPLKHGATAEDLSRFRVMRAAYWDGQTIVNGEDLLPISDQINRPGFQIQTALTAIELAKVTNQLAFIPSLAARSALVSSEITEVEVEGLKPVKRPLFLWAKMDTMDNRTFSGMTKSLKYTLAGHI
jgi:DNA-binding transcriptional LysR family regulator